MMQGAISRCDPGRSGRNAHTGLLQRRPRHPRLRRLAFERERQLGAVIGSPCGFSLGLLGQEGDELHARAFWPFKVLVRQASAVVRELELAVPWPEHSQRNADPAAACRLMPASGTTIFSCRQPSVVIKRGTDCAGRGRLLADGGASSSAAARAMLVKISPGGGWSQRRQPDDLNGSRELAEGERLASNILRLRAVVTSVSALP